MVFDMIKEVISANNYLNHITEFVSFLSTNKRTLEEILSHMVQVVLSPLNAEAILIRQLNSENQAVLVETWGISLESLQGYPVAYSLNDRYPTTDTLRFRSTTWINTLPDWGDDYPLLKELKYNTGAKSYICFPIERAGTPVAALGVFCRKVLHPNAEIESFLRAAGSILSISLYNRDSSLDEPHKGHRENMHSESKIKELTERQLVILRLISEDRTNIVISNLLGYSESTIRQETIKIFSILECKGRYAAGQIYRKEMAKSKNGWI